MTTPSPPSGAPPAGGPRGAIGPSDLRLFGLSAAGMAASFVTDVIDVGRVVPFVVSAVALALLASLVGHAVDALGDRLGAGATGVLQSALGNLPELFVCIFALRAGLYDVVRAALVGSVLANVLLVLGLAFIVGGRRHGTQTFGTARARTLSLLLVLSVFAWLIPSLTSALHTPASGHEEVLSTVTAVLLLVLFGLSIPASISREAAGAEQATDGQGDEGHGGGARWPLALTLAVLAVAPVAAA